MVLRNLIFGQKAQNFVYFGLRLVQISPAFGPDRYQIMYGETLLLSVSAFSDRTFYVTITDADIESLKSLHTLFDKYLDHMLGKFEQNRMIKNVQNFKLLGKKWLTIFEKVLMPF